MALYNGTINNDFYQGGADSDTVNGGGGGDLLNGGGGGDRIHGDNGNDLIDGQAGDDTLWGDAGSDVLRGGDGADRLDGGEGNDVLRGGAGPDVFVRSGGIDTIVDFTPGAVTTVLIDFELGVTGLGTEVPDGYMGFNWNNVFGARAAAYPANAGYNTVVNSGDEVAFDSFSNGGGFSRTNGDFDLDSLYVSSAWNNDLVVTFTAWDDGVQVGSATIVLDQADKGFIDFDALTASGVDSAIFSGRFTSIDEVRFDGTGGTDANPGDSGAGQQVALDDISVRFASQGDVIDVAPGTDIAALVASAIGTPFGTIVGGNIILQGIAPNQVSADWFV